MQRLLGYKPIPLWDKKRVDLFFYHLTDSVIEQLHHIDMGTGGAITVPEAIINPHTRDQYIVRSLIEEAITSSQIEGAATRPVAKDMLRSGRPPRDKGEEMILNNFRTMQQIRTWKEQPLSPNLVFEVHRLNKRSGLILTFSISFERVHRIFDPLVGILRGMPLNSDWTNKWVDL